jgi:ATP/maltotriose-dependent transcriptional regulator MalT
LIRHGFVAAEYGFPWPTSNAIVIQGWVQSCQGKVENGIAQMRRGVADTEASGARPPTWILIPLVETYLRIGRNEQARQLLAQALETAHQTDGRMQEAELYRLKGELSLKAPGTEAEAESCFRRASRIAQRQSARWWELRATTSLARLLAKQGHATKRTRCSPISTTGSPRASKPPT